MAPLACFALAMPAAFAQDATWLANPGSANFNTATNWTPATVPLGFATFGNSSTTTLTFSGSRNLDGFVFDAGAPAYTFNLTGGFGVVFHTDGIINNSSNAPTFNVSNSPLRFDDTSSAGNAIINLNAGTVQFLGNSTGGLAQLNAAVGTTFDFTGTVGPASDGRFSAGSISGAGNVVLNAGQHLVVGGNNLSTNFAGSISSGAIEKVGTGTVTLSGTNAYAGGTVISAGTLQANNTSAIGAGDVTLDGGAFRSGAANLNFSNDFVINPAGGTIDNGNRRLTLSGVISDSMGGPAQLTAIGGANGTTILSGANSYSGGTVISATTLQANNNNAVGIGAITLDGGTFKSGAANLNFSNDFVINAAGGTVDNGNRRLTLSGVISDSIGGPAQLTLIGGGNGTTILSGVNTYGGGTLVSHTTVQVRNNSAVGTGTVTLDQAQFQAGAANLNIGNSFAINATPAGSAIDNNNRVLTLSGNIADGNGPGMLTFVNSGAGGRTILTGTNSYTGGTDICNCATVQLGDATHTGSIVGRVRNDGEFRVLNADTTGITRIVNTGLTEFFNTSSASTARILNSGLLEFADHSTAGGATVRNVGGGVAFSNHSTAGEAIIVNRAAGLIFFADNSTAGDATITTRQFAETLFDDHSNGGNARFITNGTGVVDFSGTSGAGGLHRITAGSIEGSGSYFIGGGNTLVVGGNDRSTEVSGVIADSCGCGPGSGSLEKVGTGTMILSGLNTYTGTTAVSAGVLYVEGSIALSSLTTVNANAALTGTGTVGNATIAGGGIFLPGSGMPGSSMTVSGNLAFQSGALYLVQLDSSTSTFANVTGTATLSGSVGASVAAGSNVLPQYTILTAAGGRSGVFAGVDTLGLPAGLVASLSYDSTHAYLNFVLDYGARSNLNVNQQNVNNALANFFKANGGIPLAYAGLSSNGLSQVSGETATGTQQATFDAMNLFLGLLTDPFIAGRSDGFGGNAGASGFADEAATAYAAKRPNAARDAFARFPTKAGAARNNVFDQRWSVWGAAYGGGSTTDGNTALGSNTATARAFGFAAGADYRISPATLAGFALAGGGTNFSVNGFGSGRSDLFQAGAFVRHNAGPAYVTAALAYGWQDVTTDRTVTAAGVDQLRAQFNANAWSGRIEGGYRYMTPWVGITPYAAGQFTTYQLPAYAEQVVSGANTFALNYAAKDVTASRSELGIRTDKSFATENGILTLRGRAAWAHNFNTDRSITPVFQTLPGAAFVVNGAVQARDAALVTGSAEMKWLNGLSLAATFEGEFSGVTRSYAGKGVARYSW